MNTIQKDQIVRMGSELYTMVDCAECNQEVTCQVYSDEKGDDFLIPEQCPHCGKKVTCC